VVPELLPGQVHVWFYDLDAPAGGDGGGCLDAAEQAKAERLYRERDRQRYRAAHCAFRHLVGGYLGCAPAEVVISRECAHCGDGKHGKPAVAGPSGRLIEVNASHSDALGALAVALPPLRLGVDVECRRPGVDWAGILPAADPPPADGFAEWTRLEAAGKAAGTGITRMPRLAPAAGGGWVPAVFPDRRGEWQVRSLAAPDGYAAALAASAVPAGVEIRWHR
jgi:4'-phosphopantetheinyl transferase